MKTLILELRAPSGAVSLGLRQLFDALDRDVRDRVCGGGGWGSRYVQVTGSDNGRTQTVKVSKGTGNGQIAR